MRWFCFTGRVEEVEARLGVGSQVEVLLLIRMRSLLLLISSGDGDKVLRITSLKTARRLYIIFWRNLRQQQALHFGWAWPHWPKCCCLLEEPQGWWRWSPAGCRWLGRQVRGSSLFLSPPSWSVAIDRLRAPPHPEKKLLPRSSFQTFTVSFAKAPVSRPRMLSSEFNAVWGLKKVKRRPGGRFEKQTYSPICWMRRWKEGNKGNL